MTHLKEGDHAPLFTGLDQEGNPVSLSNYKGKRVILFFYPKDDTPTCTVQACNLRDNYLLLQQKGFYIIGVSIDTIKKHQKFKKKYDLPFPLISDEDKSIVQHFGVWGEKKFMGRTFDGTHRTTFLIDEKGIIKQIIEKPKSKFHAEEILDYWEHTGTKP